MRIPVRRRLPFIVAAFALSVLSCGREVTGPENGIYRNRVAMLAFAPEFSGPMTVIEGAGDAVPFEKVRVVLRGLDGSIVKDTMVAFPSDADEISLALSIAIPQNSPAAGLPLTVTMAYVNAAGDTVFRGGPNPVVARPVGSPGADTPVTVPVTYDGAGKDATRVAISPKTGTAVAGQTLAFSATAFDAADAAIPNTPFIFSTPDATRATVDPVTGVATWLPVRGVARVIAELPNGARADTASFTVSLPASKLVLGSGAAQTGAVNAPLADTIVVRTLASDDVPVEGVVVTFAVATGAGTLSVLTDTSDANGDVKTAWTLGAALATQTITATSAGLTGSPLTISATAVAATPVRLEITQEPTGTTAGAIFAPQLTVIARDAFGNAVPTFTDGVTVGVVGAEPPTLLGTTTRAAVGGTATFDDIGLTKAGAFQLVVSSGSLASDTTATLVIEAAEAAQLAMLSQPPMSVAAGATFSAAVDVQDAFGNRVTDWTTPVQASFDLAPTGATFVSGGSADVIDGVADFTDLQLDRAGNYRLRFTSGALTATISNDFALLAAGPEAMNTFAGDLQTAAAGSALPTPLAVVVSDNFGNPISGVTITWTVTAGGGSMSAPSSVTDSLGRASVTWTLGSVAGAQLATASAGFLPDVEFSATATAGAATHVVFISQPDTAVAGAPFPPTLYVEFRDAFGNRDASLSDSVTMSIESGPPGGELLPANVLTQSITDGGGASAGQFAGLEIRTAGTYVLRATTKGGLTGLSQPLVVVPNGALQFFLVSGAFDTAAVNQPFAEPLRVRVTDSFGNPVQGAKTWWIDQGGGATFALDTVLTDADGYAENTATHGPTAVAMSAITAFVVGSADSRDFFYTTVAGAATQMVILDQPDSAVAGDAFSPSIWIEARDAFGNRATSWSDSVRIVVDSGPSGGVVRHPVLGDRAEFLTNGGGPVYGALGGYEIEVAGTYRLRVVADGGLSVALAPFTVRATTPELLAKVSGGDETGAVLQAFAAPLRVRVTDQFQNPVGGVKVAWVDQGGGAVVAADTTLTDIDGYTEVSVMHGATPVALGAIQAQLGPLAWQSFAYTTTTAAPSALVNAGGDGQSVTVMAYVASPLRARVTDAFGNGVSGVTVNFNVISGLATVDAASVATDSAGYAATLVRMDSVAGPVLVGAFAAGLTPDSLLYSLTALPDVPNALLVVRGGALTVAAGDTTDTLRVQLKDAYGNPIAGETVTWDSPSGLTFTSASGVTDSLGHVSTTVVAGGTLGVLDVYARYDQPVLSAYFGVNVLVGPAFGLTIVSGDGQSGFTGFPLDAPIELRVTDAFDNPVAGDTVIVTRGIGTGVLGDLQDSLVIETNSDGYALAYWTLGAEAGTQTLSARTGTLGPVTISATAVQAVANAIWTGTVSGSTSDAANWRNGLVPTSADSVLFPAGTPNQPTLDASVTYAKLTVEDGALLNVAAYDVAVLGDVHAPGSGIVASNGGSVLLFGSGTISGRFPAIGVQGPYATAGDVIVAGPLGLGESADFTLSSGDSLHVDGNLTTSAGGSFAQALASAMFVNGDMSLGGGTSTFAGGARLHLFGNLTTTSLGAPTAFLPDSAHELRLTSGANHFIAFSTADITPDGSCTASCLGMVFADGEGTSLLFSSDAMSIGGFFVGTESEITALYGNGRRVVAAVPSTLRAVSGNRFGTFGFTESFAVSYFETDSLAAFGSGYLPANLAYPTIIAGQYLINDVHNAALIVDGVLGVEGNAAVVNGEFRTRGSGWLAMTEPSDSLVVTGGAYFEGSAESGQLTAGVLDVQGEMFYVGAGGSLVADSGHVLRLANGSFTTLQVGDSVGTRLGSLRVEANTTVSLLADGVRFAGDVTIDGLESAVEPNGIVWAEIGGQLRDAVGSRFTANAILTGTDAIATPRFAGSMLDVRGTNTLVDSLNAQRLTVGSGGNLIINGQRVGVDSLYTAGSGILTMANPADVVTVLGTALFSGGPSILTDGRLRLAGRVDGNGVAFQGAPTHTTEFFGSAVQQVGFGQRGFGATEAHFGSVELAKSGGAPFSSTDLYINGQLITAAPAQRWSGTGASQPLYVRGANISYLELPNQPLIIVDGADVTRLDSLRFTSFDSAATQLSIARGGGIVPVNAPAFDSTAADAVYLRVDDVLAGADILTIQVSDARPFGHDGRVTQVGGALILGWGDFAALVWTGDVDGDWLNAANWQQNRVPTGADSVIVPSEFSNPPTLAADTAVRAIVVDPSQGVTLTAMLTIRGGFTGLNEGPSITCATGGSVTFDLADSAMVQGRLGCHTVVSSGRLGVSNTFMVDSLVIDGNGEIHIDDDDVLTVQYDLLASENGTLRMDGSTGGDVYIEGSAVFEGTPMAGSLTAGRLHIYEDFTQQASSGAFAASATHETVLAGSVNQFVRFEHPDPITGSRFGRLRLQQAGGEAAVRLQSDVYAEGELILLSGTTETLVGDGAHRLLRARGIENNSDGSAEFVDVRLEVIDGGTLNGQLYGFRFSGFTVAGTPQLRIARAGALVTLNFFQFDSEATSPLFLQVEDTDGPGQTMTAVTLVGTTPTFHGGAVETLGGASILGWDAEELFVWSSLSSTTWDDPNNWSLNSVPDASSKVIIPSTATVSPQLGAETEIGSLTVLSPTFGVTVDAWTLVIRDSLVAATSGTLVQCWEGGTIRFAPTDTAWVQANTTCGIQVTSGTLTTRGTLATTQSLNIRGSGVFAPRHNVVASVGGTGDNGPLGELRTEESGRFLMLEPGIEVDLAGGAIFKGGVSQLDAGTLIVADALVADSNLVTLTGSPAHVTELGLYSNQGVTFAFPAQNSVGSLRLASGVSRSVFTPITITGDLIVPSTSTISFDSAATIGGNLDIAGQSYCGSGTALTLSHADATKTFRAVVPTCDVALTAGDYAMADGPSSVKTLTIDGSAMFDVAGRTLRVVDSLVTLGEGTLRMQSANDSVLVERDARFAGGTTAGALTDGLLLVERHFTQSNATTATSFAPSGSHRTLLGDSTITNVIAIEIPTSRVHFDTPDFSAFNAVEVYGGWVELQSAARALDAASARAGTRLSGSRFFADNGFEGAGITFLDNLSVAGRLQVSQSFTADTVEFRGPAGGDTEQEIPNDDGETSIPYSTILVSGPNVVMRDVSRGAYFLDRLHVSAGSLMLGGGVGILADEGTMAVTGSAALSFEEGQTTTLTFDSVYIATSVPVEPFGGAMSFRSFVQSGFSNFRAGGSYTASPRGTGVIGFQDSETSYFRNLSFSPGSMTTLLSDVQLTGRLSRVPGEESVTLQSDILDINPRTVLVAGGLGFSGTESGQTYFRNVALSLSGSYTSPSEIEFNDVTFERMDPNPAQAYLFSQHAGGAAATWSDITFNSQLESGLYFRWDATPDGSSVTFVNATPALDCLASTCQQGDYAPIGGQQTATWTGASDDNWANVANWNEGSVPTAASDVIIANSGTNVPTAPAGAQFRSLTVEADQMLYIDNGGTVTVYGDVDIRGALLRRDEFSELLLRPADTASFSAEGGYIDTRISIDRGIGSTDGTVRLASDVTLDSASAENHLRVYGGTLDINGHSLMVGGEFNTLNHGRLKMTGSSVMTVMWDAMFMGESTDGLLTGGELRLYRGLYQYKGESDATFRSTGEHTVSFVGFFGNDISFESSDASTGSRIGVLRISKIDGSVSMNSGDVYVENIAGTFTSADLLVGASGAAHLWVIGTIDSTVSSSDRGFSLGELGFVTAVNGLGAGCTENSLIVYGAGSGNFTPSECRLIP